MARLPKPRARGPNPLGQHLAQIAFMWQSGLNVAAAARVGLYDWHPSLGAEAAALTKAMAMIPPEALAKAMIDEAKTRLAQVQLGVDAYRASPHQRAADLRPVIKRIGAARLLGPINAKPGAPKILVVPSLINRWHILDLDPGHGLLSALETAGLAPYLLDHGDPDRAEAGFDAAAYVTQRLAPALDIVANHNSAGPAPKIGVIGHCLGGVLALGLAALMPERLSALALLATPWDFTKLRSTQSLAMQWASGSMLHDSVLDGSGILPADLVAAIMALADGGLIEAKYRQFPNLEPESAEARRFVLIEDWAQGAIPLAKPVAAQVFRDWLAGRGPAQGGFMVGNQVVDPKVIATPSLIIQSPRDRLVPPAAALSLAETLAHARVIEPDGGHLGMIIGRETHQTQAEIAQFLLEQTPIPAYRTSRRSAKRPTTRTNKSQPR